MTLHRLDHYEILGLIGRGGMGIVYRARDLRLGRTVAVKVLPGDFGADPGRRSRFLREARAAASLNHPNIATIYEMGEAEVEDPELIPPGARGVDGHREVFYIAMELVEGIDLRELAETPLPLAKVLDIALQVVDALEAAHRLGVIHRDLKPGNIRITPDGRAKLLDFGLAKLLHQRPVEGEGSQTHLTLDGTILGTPPYIAPEQLHGGAVDGRSDLFSFGVLLYELLAGRPPFPGDNLVRYVRALGSGVAPPLSDSRPGTPPELESIVSRLLAPEPNDRYGAAGEVAADLARLAGTREERLGPGSAPEGWVRWPARGTLLAAGSLLLLVLALAYTLDRWRSGGGEPVFKNVAVLPFANRIGGDQQRFFCEGIGRVLGDRLREIPGLNVVDAPDSYDGDEPAAAAKVGRQLGVGMVLTGKVSWAGRDAAGRERVRVAVQLVDTTGGLVLWDRQIEGTRTPILPLQLELNREVGRALSASLSLEDRERLAANPTRFPDAFESYLQALQALDEKGRAGHLELAEHFFTEALTRDDRFALAYAGLSETLRREFGSSREPEVLQRAEEAAERAVALDPKLPTARISLANVYRVKGRYTEAIAELRQVLARNPNLDAAYRDLAKSYEKQGDLARTEESYREAIHIRPDYWLSWNELGAFLLRKGDRQAAREAFERSIALAGPGTTWPYQNLIALELLNGDPAAAIAAYERAPQPVTDADLASNIGSAYFSLGQLEKAEESYRLATTLRPQDDVLWRNLGDLYVRRREAEEARGAYRQALELVNRDLEVDPRDPARRLRHALYLAKASDCDAAVQEAATLVQALPATADTAHFLAQTFALCDRPANALAEARRAVELGYSRDTLSAEDELRSLRDDPAFQELVTAPANDAAPLTGTP